MTTCYKCGTHSTPKWHEKQIKIETGSSSGSWSGRIKADKTGAHGIRYNTGRTYYRHKWVTVCQSCFDGERAPIIFLLIFFILGWLAFEFTNQMGYLPGIIHFLGWDQPPPPPPEIQPGSVDILYPESPEPKYDSKP